MSQNSSGNRNVTGRVSDLPSSNKATVSKPPTNKQDASSSDAKSDSVIQDESGVTYRVVHLPSDFFQTSPAGANQNLIAPSAEVANVGDNNAQQQQQPLVLNVSSLGTTPLAIASTASQVQLQGLDNGAGQQYYIMIPSGDLLPGVNVSSGGSGSGPGSQMTRSQSRKSSQTTKIDQSGASVAAAIQQAVGSSSNNPSLPTVTAFIHENEGPALPHKEIRRRVSHNEVEKRRRDKINNWINKLARLVPAAAAEESGKHAQSKGGVLAKTVDYIHELKSISADVQKLRAHVRDLARENKILKQKLNENGISVPTVPKSTSPSQQGAAGGQAGVAGANRNQPLQAPISIAPKGRIIPVNLASAGTVLLLSQDAATGAFSLTQPGNMAVQQSSDVEDESMEMQL